VTADVTIEGIATSEMPNGELWLRRVVENGGAARTDILGYHFEEAEGSGFLEDELTERLERLLTIVREGGAEAAPPIWLKMSRNEAPATSAASDESAGEQADRLQRIVLGARVAGVARLFLPSMHEHAYPGVGAAGELLVTEDGYLQPAAAGLSALTWQLAGMEFVKRVEPAEDFRAYLFESEGRTLAVLARRPGDSGAYPVPRKEGVVVEDFLGNPLPAGAKAEGTLVFMGGEIALEELAKMLAEPEN
jgi:hypothetical protein